MSSSTTLFATCLVARLGSRTAIGSQNASARVTCTSRIDSATSSRADSKMLSRADTRSVQLVDAGEREAQAHEVPLRIAGSQDVRL